MGVASRLRAATYQAKTRVLDAAEHNRALRWLTVRLPRTTPPPLAGAQSTGQRDRVTWPPSFGTSSRNVWPAGTFTGSPDFVVSSRSLLRSFLLQRIGSALSPHDEHGVALAEEQRLGHRVARGVLVAGVALTDPQDQHVVDLEVLAGSALLLVRTQWPLW